MSFQLIKQLNRIFQIITVLTLIFTETIRAEELIDFVDDEPDQVTNEYRKFLDEEYTELQFYPKYHNGRICRVLSDRPGLHNLDKIRDAKDVLYYSPSRVRINMIGDKCEFEVDNPKVLGNAKLAIEGQETLLKANEITFEKATQIVHAEGNVQIYINGIVSKGSSWKFRIEDPHFLLQTTKANFGSIGVRARGERNFRFVELESEKLIDEWLRAETTKKERIAIEQKILDNWHHPHMPDEVADSTVNCALRRDGSISDLKLVNGHFGIFNKVSLKAVSKAAPFKPLNAKAPREILMTVSFRPRKFKADSISVKFEKSAISRRNRQ